MVLRNEPLDRHQYRVQGEIDALKGGLFANAVLLEDVELTTSAKPIRTGLSRVRGYIVVRKQANLTVSDEGIAGGTIQLKYSSTDIIPSAVVSLVVF